MIPLKPPLKPAGRSRTARWNDAASRAVEALRNLQELQDEYKGWSENLPENLLQASAISEKLDAVCDLDIEGALNTAEEAEALDLPLGFGRD